MAPPRPKRHRARALAAALALAWAGVAPAEDLPEVLRPPEGGSARPEDPTWVYASGRTEATPWRAAFEEAAIYAASITAYALKPMTAPNASPVALSDKLTLDRRGLVFDADNIPTNYPGHGVAGMWYYLLARGNRLSVASSFALTAAMSAMWELSEFKEPASANDLVTTSFGGFALGEAFTQLGAYLDRQEGAGARVLGFLAQVPKGLHDWADGARPARGAPWGGHRIVLAFQPGIAWPRPGGLAPEWGFAAHVDLLRTEDYGAPGSGLRPLLDGNASALGAEVAFDGQGMSEVDVFAAASFAGVYARDLDEDGDGQDLVATLGTAFDFRRRTDPSGAYGGGDWPWDFLALLRVPGASVRWRLLAGGLRVEWSLEAAVVFGGVTPYGILGLPTADLPGAPGVLALNGYYHGIGAMAAPRLAVRAGDLTVEGGVRVDALRSVSARDVAPPAEAPLALRDRNVDLDAAAAWRTPWSGVEVGAAWRRRLRSGRAGDAVHERAESRLLLRFGIAL
jgi:hypothetical protein